MKINWKAGFLALRQYFTFKAQTLLQPKALRLNRDQVETVRGMFVCGSTPESIGRYIDDLFGRRHFKYFRVFNDKTMRYEFGEAFDYEMDGIEYINAAMIAVGALRKKRDGWYYDTTNDMVKVLAAKMVQAPLPEKKGV